MEKKDQSGLAITSLVLGIVGVFAWFLPICGFPVAIVGLILGILGVKSEKHGLAIAGIVLCSISLLLTIVNAIFGALIGINNYLNAL